MNWLQMDWLDWRWLVTAFVIGIVWILAGIAWHQLHHPPKNGHYTDLEAPFRDP